MIRGRLRAGGGRGSCFSQFILVLLCVSASMSTWAIMDTFFGCEGYASGSREESLQRSLDHYKIQYDNLRKRISEVRCSRGLRTG